MQIYRMNKKSKQIIMDPEYIEAFEKEKQDVINLKRKFMVLN